MSDANPKPERRVTDRRGRSASVIGESSFFRGTFGGDDDYLVFGTVEGECDILGGLIVQPGGTWKGNATVNDLIVSGTVEGNVTARNKIELTAGAHVRGSLSAPAIAIAEGAVHEGELHVQREDAVMYFNDRRGK